MSYSLWFCADCTAVAVNGDTSGVPDELLPAVEAGISLMGNVDYIGDESTDIDFSSARCDCCGSRLGGSRFEFVPIETAASA